MAAPQTVPPVSCERIGPDRLDLEVQADAGDFDVECLRQAPAVRQLEPQAAVRHVHDRGGRPSAVTRKPPTTRFRGQRRCRRTAASISLTVLQELRRP